MAKKQHEIPKITVANTKKEMLEAYNLLRQRLESAAEHELQPEKAKEVRHEREAAKAADELAATRITGSIDAIKSEIGTSLAEIAARMEQETARYLKVKEAIAAKEKELEEIFEIEKSAYALAALLEAQKQKRTLFEEEIEQTRAIWEREKAEYAAQILEQKEADRKLRQREQEEYDYHSKREKEQKIAALQDETARLEKDIAARKEAFDKQAAAKEAEFKEREDALAGREQEMSALRTKVEAFPEELAAAVKKAVREVTDRLTGETAKNEELLLKTFEGEKNVLATKIEAFEQITAEQKKQIESLAQQIEKAYGKVQDIAVKAVSVPSQRLGQEPAPKPPGRQQEP